MDSATPVGNGAGRIGTAAARGGLPESLAKLEPIDWRNAPVDPLMPKRRSRSKTALAAQVTDLAFSVPQVVAHRMARMASAGSNPSARDRDEFYLMGAEKVAAFYESWAAMQLEGYRLSQQLWLSSLQSAWMPWLAGPRPGKRQARRAANRILAQGLRPVTRRASANARRLAKRKLK